MSGMVVAEVISITGRVAEPGNMSTAVIGHGPGIAYAMVWTGCWMA